jgi:hypothetical protein
MPQTLTVEIRDLNVDGNTGFDNSRPDKDVDNLVKNEYLGGRNPELAAAGLPSEGGVFLGQLFEFFSTSEPRFFDAFPPLRETQGPPRRALPADDGAVNLQVSLLGALIASSVTHLVGHAVGLPVEAGFHNVGDQGCFMDIGVVRSFAERAKLDGARERWCPSEAKYLNKILPAN